ncbi:hypothetical protein QWJ26_03985 [Streptomyces sp. CSDS2]|uniref:hypothetical protein n=1 Tax=Streptomyces sp. CSDS2 TaxID=3055051 RepID=UPI0025AF49CC|nr:hypothetical protein [Streptomyces sp. CSDS2]MDN3258977.1 hypothetical protein [Streptomyces sp. CSDS2]
MTDNMQTAKDYCVLLRCLSRYLDDLGADTPAIDDVLLRWAGALPVRSPEPGRLGLAEQLQGSLEASPAGLSEPAPLSGPWSVASPGQLRTLLVALAAGFAQDRVWTADRPARL